MNIGLVLLPLALMGADDESFGLVPQRLFDFGFSVKEVEIVLRLSRDKKEAETSVGSLPLPDDSTAPPLPAATCPGPCPIQPKGLTLEDVKAAVREELESLGPPEFNRVETPRTFATSHGHVLPYPRAGKQWQWNPRTQSYFEGDEGFDYYATSTGGTVRVPKGGTCYEYWTPQGMVTDYTVGYSYGPTYSYTPDYSMGYSHYPATSYDYSVPTSRYTGNPVEPAVFPRAARFLRNTFGNYSTSNSYPQSYSYGQSSYEGGCPSCAGGSCSW